MQSNGCEGRKQSLQPKITGDRGAGFGAQSGESSLKPVRKVLELYEMQMRA
jgi:hypothetical protein